MSAKDLFLRVECYVGLRRALGYVVTSEEKLLKEFDIIDSVKPSGTLIVKSSGWKDEDVEKKLSTPVRKAIATKSLSLFVLDPTASAKVTEEPELENFLLQLADAKADLLGSC